MQLTQFAVAICTKNHLYTVLYDNAVVLFPSLVIDDTQGLTFSVCQNTHTQTHTHSRTLTHTRTHTLLSQGGENREISWVDSPKNTWQKHRFHFHRQNSKIQICWQTEGKKPISRSHDISWWCESRDDTEKKPPRSMCVFLWLHCHCAYYS